MTTITVDLECCHAENIGEFYPEAITAAARAIELLEEPGTRAHRDAGVLAACAVASALNVLASEGLAS